MSADLMTRSRCWLAGIALAAPLAGCAGISTSDLPAEPIAVVHRTSDETERLKDLQESRQPSERGATPTASLEDLGDYFGITGRSQRMRRDLAGRLGFIHPQELEVEAQEFASPGDIPLDWSPDHRRLLFLTRRANAGQVMEWDQEARQVTPLTSEREVYRDAAFGPGGSLVFARAMTVRGQRHAGTQLVVREPGRRPRVLTSGPNDNGPTWSPSGDVILFTTLSPEGELMVASVPAGGGPRKALTRGRDPVFSRDGAWVYYTARSRGRWRVYRMRPDGSGRQAIGNSGFDEGLPQPSPDGRYLLYVAVNPEQQGGVPTLRIRDLQGNADRPISVNGTALSPVW